jgi:hypothetical protein
MMPISGYFWVPPLFKSFFKREHASPIGVAKIPQHCKTLSKRQKLAHNVTLFPENSFSIARIVPKR